MATKRVGQKIAMPSIDDLLGVPASEGSTEIEVAKIHAFKDHPFKVVDDDKMHELVESIMENGVLTPVIVREDAQGGYEMISGHRRLFAVKQIGLETVPAIIRDMSDDEATVAMVDSNLQREEILPSEKAFAYKMRYDAMRRKAGRPKNSSQNETNIGGKNVSQNGTNLSGGIYSKELGRNLRADEELAAIMGESRNQVQRYLRLVELIPEILDLVDTKAIALMTAVDISYIDKDVQKWLYEYMKENGACKSFQIIALREYLSEHDGITQMQMIKVLNENIPGTQPSHKITLNQKKLHEYFPAFFTKAQMENVIFKLLEQWKNEQEGDGDEV